MLPRRNTGNQTEQRFSVAYDTPRLLATCNSRGDRTQPQEPRGSIELLQSAAASELGQPDRLVTGHFVPRHLRGQAYLLARHGKEAASEFEKFSDQRGVVLNFPLCALAHIGLARAYALQGRQESRRLPGFSNAMERRRPRDSHPERSRSRVLLS